MTTDDRRKPQAGWWAFAVATIAIAAAAIALQIVAPSDIPPSAILTQSPTWLVVMTPSLIAAVAATLWTASLGVARVARWAGAASLAVAVYWLAPALAGWLMANGLEATWLMAAACFYGTCGWMLCLALLQLTALAAAEASVGRPFARSGWWFVGSAAVLALVSSALFPYVPPELTAVPTLLPPDVAASPTAQTTSAAIALVWMGSLFVAPVALWVAAMRSRGGDRRAFARVAVGGLLPAVVVALCGVLATTERWGAPSVEVNGLALGFSVAFPATIAWLAATVRDARSASATVTSVGSIVRIVLWTLYVLVAAQTIAPLAGLVGGGAGSGALIAVGLLAATFVPWRLFVAWCARKADPRAAIAAAIVSADRGGAAADLAQRALQEALGDPDARLVLALDVGGWIDTTGAVSPAPGPGAIAVETARGSLIAVLTTTERFVDARALIRAVQPVIERAKLEADVRAQAERIAAEGQRADLAAVEARRSIERDLHDGVQGRLVSLGLGLSLARDDTPDPVSRGLLDETIANLHAAVAELRELSSGSVSTRLADHGLAAAVGDLAARMPIPVALDIRPPSSLSPVAMSTAYFVVAESLANVVKHSAAAHASVAVSGERELLVSVHDDGTGGADLRAGTGLRGLQERVHAVGGRLIVSESAPHGTLVEAILPCG